LSIGIGSKGGRSILSYERLEGRPGSHRKEGKTQEEESRGHGGEGMHHASTRAGVSKIEEKTKVTTKKGYMSQTGSRKSRVPT